MKILIPENNSEITLEQFLKINALESEGLELLHDKVSILTGLTKEAIKTLPARELFDIHDKINKALEVEAEFKPTFKLGDMWFGLANFDKISIDELAFVQKGIEDVNNLNKIMAILFKPVKRKVWRFYSLYNIKNNEDLNELMLQAPMSQVNGMLFFFTNLSKDLQNFIQKYTEEKQEATREQAQ